MPMPMLCAVMMKVDNANWKHKMVFFIINSAGLQWELIVSAANSSQQFHQIIKCKNTLAPLRYGMALSALYNIQCRK